MSRIELHALVRRGDSDEGAAHGFLAAVAPWALVPRSDSATEIVCAVAGRLHRIGVSMAVDKEFVPQGWIPVFSVQSIAGAVVTTMAQAGTNAEVSTEVPGLGKFALMRDPWGAAFGILEKSGIGLAESGSGATTGTMCFHELVTSARNMQAVAEFYASVTQWTVEERAHGGEKEERTTLCHDGKIVVGLRKAEDVHGMASVSHRWITYAWVDDVAASVKAAEANGGRVLFPVTPLPQAHYAIVEDGQGAVLGVYSMDKAEGDDGAKSGKRKARENGAGGAKKSKKASHKIRFPLTTSATAEAVFEAVSTRDGLRGWFTDHVAMTEKLVRLGFGIRYDGSYVYVHEFEITASEPGRLFELTCKMSNLEREWVGTKLRFEIDGGKLVFTHVGLTGECKSFDSTERSWAELLQVYLTEFLATGKANPKFR